MKAWCGHEQVRWAAGELLEAMGARCGWVQSLINRGVTTSQLGILAREGLLAHVGFMPPGSHGWHKQRYAPPAWVCRECWLDVFAAAGVAVALTEDNLAMREYRGTSEVEEVITKLAHQMHMLLGPH